MSEELALGLEFGELERRFVFESGVIEAAEPAKQIGARGMEQVIPAQFAARVDRVNEQQRGLWSIDH